MNYQLKLANGNTYDVMDNSHFVPSGVSTARNKFYLYMDNIELSAFEALLTAENLAEMTFYVYDGDELKSETIYKLYDIISAMGKKQVEALDITTGQSVQKMVCFADLEQPTEIEQKLRELGVV